MPNHDFNSPCECTECRTAFRTETCPSCGFENCVATIGTATFLRDRKGVGDYAFEHPSTPAMDLACRRCRSTMKGVAFYSYVDEDACRRRLTRLEIEATAQPCSKCGRRMESRDGRDQPVALAERAGAMLCAKCMVTAVKSASPDPSDRDSRYAFNARTLRWELSKRRVACDRCKKTHWVSPDEHWKRLCASCYRARSKA